MSKQKKKEKAEYHFTCRGANSKCRIVTVNKLEGNYNFKCPRLQKELQYMLSENQQAQRSLPYMCYCGDLDKEIPVVEQKDFLKNKIFDCYLFN